MLRLVIVSPSGELSRTTAAKVSFPGDGGEEHRLGIAGGFVRVLRDEVEACVEVNDEKY